MTTSQQELQRFITFLVDREPESGEAGYTVACTSPRGAKWPVGYETPFTDWVDKGCPGKRASYFVTGLVDGCTTNADYFDYPSHADFILAHPRDFPRAGKANLVTQGYLVLDDIMTKSEARPAVAPTWVVETSPGNFQFGYALKTAGLPLVRACFAALLDAAKEDDAAKEAAEKTGATYTSRYNLGDKKAVYPCRLVRLPHSWHTTSETYARLVEFEPELEYDLLDLTNMLTLGERDVDYDPNATYIEQRVNAVVVDDPTIERDLILRWLRDSGYLMTESPDSAGFFQIECPGWETHSDGNKLAGYSPFGAGSLPDAAVFYCFHEHCMDRSTDKFLTWVTLNGGPKPGLAPMLPDGDVDRPDRPDLTRQLHGTKLAGWLMAHEPEVVAAVEALTPEPTPAPAPAVVVPALPAEPAEPVSGDFHLTEIERYLDRNNALSERWDSVFADHIIGEVISDGSVSGGAVCVWPTQSKITADQMPTPMPATALPDVVMTAKGKVTPVQRATLNNIRAIVEYLGGSCVRDARTGELNYHGGWFEKYPRGSINQRESLILNTCYSLGIDAKNHIIDRVELLTQTHDTFYTWLVETLEEVDDEAEKKGMTMAELVAGSIDKVRECVPVSTRFYPKADELWSWAFRKWMIQGVECAYASWATKDDLPAARLRLTGGAIDSAKAGVLYLLGSQGLGKTRFFKMLAPDGMFSDGVNLDFGNNAKDSIMAALANPIVELGEIETTFRKSDQESLKAFISAEENTFRPPYGRHNITVKRATSFGATGNRTAALTDNTGNRRFWPFYLSGVMDTDRVRSLRKYVWAEAFLLWAAGSPWWTTKEEEEMLQEVGTAHSSDKDYRDAIDMTYEVLAVPDNVTQLADCYPGALWPVKARLIIESVPELAAMPFKAARQTIEDVYGPPVSVQRRVGLESRRERVTGWWLKRVDGTDNMDKYKAVIAGLKIVGGE